MEDIDHTDFDLGVARCEHYAATTGQTCHLFDGVWNGKRFLHLIPDAWLAPVDKPHIVHTARGES